MKIGHGIQAIRLVLLAYLINDDMKIIINLSIGNIFKKIAVFKNGQLMAVCPARKNYGVFDAMEGDRIEIKQGYVTVASFVCREGHDTFYVGLTKMHKIWEWFNFCMFPYLTLALFVFKDRGGADAYDWLCTGMLVLTVLSLISLQSCVSNPRLRNKMFKLDVL